MQFGPAFSCLAFSVAPLWHTSPAGWLPRTGISSGTLRSVIEYGLALLFSTYREVSWPAFLAAARKRRGSEATEECREWWEWSCRRWECASRWWWMWGQGTAPRSKGKSRCSSPPDSPTASIRYSPRNSTCRSENKNKHWCVQVF